ncbi:MAG: cytidylate kinase-like family protein [Ruminococcus sp.]|nr:cytidylate kinase-like family protein [Ruminococcus sp.]
MKFNYIVIEREYASGGTEIGKRIADILDIPCYGKEIPEITSQRTDISVERILELEENATGSLLYSLSRMTSFMSGNNREINAFESVIIEEMETIRKLSGNGPAVFVGRSAAKVLADRDDVLKVFIHASNDFREHRGMKVYKVCRSEIKETLKKYDKRRASFYKENFGTDWKNYADYDLVLDSSVLGIEKCAAVIAECAK